MIHLYDFKIIKSSKRYIDDQILGNLNKDIIIATNDKELRKRLKNHNIRTIFLRGNNYLMMD